MHIYHEKQQRNLCALHAINGLLQAPLYCLEFLISISQNLDEMELSLMESPNNFQSQNMDNSAFSTLHFPALVYLGDQRSKTIVSFERR